jgi:hypothetical protein
MGQVRTRKELFWPIAGYPFVISLLHKNIPYLNLPKKDNENHLNWLNKATSFALSIFLTKYRPDMLVSSHRYRQYSLPKSVDRQSKRDQL